MIKLKLAKYNEKGEFEKKHGRSRDPIYYTWQAMKARCLNKDHPSYHNYGGRGIKVCDRWLTSFESFLSDMGERPKGTSLDRIDNEGNYEPSNCRWITHQQQCLNTRNNVNLTFRGITKTLSEWCDETGVEFNKARFRIKRGYPLERVFNPKQITGKEIIRKTHYKARFTDIEVFTIINLYVSGVSGVKIAKNFKVGEEMIYNILRGKTYKHLDIFRPLDKSLNPELWSKIK